jgi:tRNA modification GTPase
VRADDAASVAGVWDAIERAASPLLRSADGMALHEHQRSSCREAAQMLRTGSSDPLVIAEHLRGARACLAHITGAAATEAMLDLLFGRFCIGK